MTSRWWRIGLGSLVAAALIAIGASGAVILGLGGNDYPTADSVDAGFSRDMATHHRQAVLMAGLARDRSTDAEVALIAYDIETVQLHQVGQMQGWLALWGLSQSASEPMSWIPDHDHAGMAMGGSDTAGMDMGTTGHGLMPGMASADELDELRAADGAEFDILFLQLMIRHHQGGAPMALYAAEHAAIDPVRTLARSMAETQAAETDTLTDMLTARGGTPLPAP
ncbi:MAG: DUF305 domain-containing protein [Actinomycetota bacterium]|nr:DUF305 domain-containing protein [Actinomycetota bacterium]